MDIGKLDRAEEALHELRAMAGRISCSEDKEGIIRNLRQLSALEKELSEDAESESERKMCHQIRKLVRDFVRAFLPADP